VPPLSSPISSTTTYQQFAEITSLPTLCTCCDQKKDHKRPEEKWRCCAKSKEDCCKSFPARYTIIAIRRTLRAALNQVIREELISKNVAALTTLPSASKTKKPRPRMVWSVDEARRFLEHLREADDPLYAAYVLILFLGLRRGEALGLTWNSIDVESEEVSITHQLTRVGGHLLHRDTTKTIDSEATLPLLGLCITALEHRRAKQAAAKQKAGEAWTQSDLVFTTKFGTPVEPRNFDRAFKAHCRHAAVPCIRVHDTRRTCGSLLAALDVHPRVAMQILRHSQISVTMNIYTQIPSVETRKALERLNDQLDIGGGSDARA
jgi:integrase